jgi:hypothetical protein
VIFVDDGNPDPRGGGISLAAEHHREYRKKDDREDERQRLRDPVTAQIDPSDAQQGAHYSRNSRPVR